jgi:hypothetical protein
MPVQPVLEQALKSLGFLEHAEMTRVLEQDRLGVG